MRSFELPTLDEHFARAFAEYSLLLIRFGMYMVVVVGEAMKASKHTWQ